MIIYTRILTTEECFKKGFDDLFKILTEQRSRHKCEEYIKTLNDQELADLKYGVDCLHDVTCVMNDFISNHIREERKHIEKIEVKEMILE